MAVGFPTWRAQTLCPRMQAVSPAVPTEAHKHLSRLVALVLFVAVAAGAALLLRPHAESAYRPHAESAHTFAAAHLSGNARSSVATAVSAFPARAKAAGPVVRSLPPDIVVRSMQQVLINQDRARYGLRPLTWSACLGSIAYSNATRMANQGYISHADGTTRGLGCHLGYRAGENVGWWSGAVNDVQLNTMFMNSPDHRANILGPYHYVATAWVTAPNGHTYIAVEFS